MNKGLEKYWLDQRRLWKRDVKAGHVSGDHKADLRAYWDDKVEYRSHEHDPSATFTQYLDFVLSSKPEKKTAKKSKKKASKKKAKKKRKSGWFGLW